VTTITVIENDDPPRVMDLAELFADFFDARHDSPTSCTLSLDGWEDAIDDLAAIRVPPPVPLIMHETRWREIRAIVVAEPRYGYWPWEPAHPPPRTGRRGRKARRAKLWGTP